MRLSQLLRCLLQWSNSWFEKWIYQRNTTRVLQPYIWPLTNFCSHIFDVRSSDFLKSIEGQIACHWAYESWLVLVGLCSELRIRLSYYVHLTFGDNKNVYPRENLDQGRYLNYHWKNDSHIILFLEELRHILKGMFCLCSCSYLDSTNCIQSDKPWSENFVEMKRLCRQCYKLFVFCIFCLIVFTSDLHTFFIVYLRSDGMLLGISIMT